jgi:Protein involved in chromosome segregation, interacts with SMC proteins
MSKVVLRFRKVPCKTDKGVDELSKRYYPVIIGTVGVVMSVITWYIMRASRTSLVIKYGIIGADDIQKYSFLVILIISILFIIIGMPGLIKEVRNNRAERKMSTMTLNYRSKKSGPEEIREQLVLMQDQRFEIKDKIGICITQIDEIENQMDRFGHLIKINEAESLTSAIEAIEETRDTVCSNLRWIINSNIAVSEKDAATLNKLSENINKVIELNKALIEKDEEFLLTIADYLSQIDDKEQVFQLDVWCEVIKKMNQKSLMGVR